jgi:hypothetical protein
MKRSSPDHPVLLPSTVWQLSALDRLLTRLIGPEGKFDAALILRAADGDKELYAEMLLALINVQASARRLIATVDRSTAGLRPGASNEVDGACSHAH